MVSPSSGTRKLLICNMLVFYIVCLNLSINNFLGPVLLYLKFIDKFNKSEGKRHAHIIKINGFQVQSENVQLRYDHL